MKSAPRSTDRQIRQFLRSRNFPQTKNEKDKDLGVLLRANGANKDFRRLLPSSKRSASLIDLMFARKRSAASADSIRVLALSASWSNLPNVRNDLIAEFKSATRLSFGKVSKSPVRACRSYAVTS